MTNTILTFIDIQNNEILKKKVIYTRILASFNCLCDSNVFQNGVTISKIVNHFAKRLNSSVINGNIKFKFGKLISAVNLPLKLYRCKC